MIAAGPVAVGSPTLHGSDLAATSPGRDALSLRVACPRFYNMRPPNSGLASAVILCFEGELTSLRNHGFDFRHLLVERRGQAGHWPARGPLWTDEALSIGCAPRNPF